ncbi:major facilitator superfamily domain-containing protein [Colletotrichum godetiae]|uniref:Major facilitator superfamily domain-containing protein n=1 Tax=Colletotrichum godetiae TaxID=1209918 RepID=A0AAJ0AMI0_9PEZI|nr:major facilitator superfamily domain-containing protein [Colletotrichum godetiae]KAK1676631.1 major facilitator superfamily domain-containing protein [Colletotrichum godetiae]
MATNTEEPRHSAEEGATASSISHEDKEAKGLYRLEREPTREEKTAEALAEGHDADIPSSMGYVLDERGEEKRKHSIALARTRSRKSMAREDVERGVGGGSAEKDGDGDGGESSEDENIVWWDGPDDPANPYNWPSWLKVLNCSLISAMTFVTPLASSIFAPGVPDLMREFHNNSPYLAAFVVSVYVLGFAAGPLLCAPLSEIYGRTIVYHVCNLFFICFNVGAALAPTLNALIVFRLFAGVFGSAPITNGAGSISDMIRQEKRGAAMAAFSIGPLLGPIIGPVAGGFLADAAGWRWVFWLIVIVSGVLSIVMLVFSRETYAPIILDRKVKRLQKETGNPLLRSKLDIGLSSIDYFKRGIIRPIKMIAFSPITQIFGLYIAVVYGYLYLMFTSITSVFMGTYGFSAGTSGLAFMGLGVGSMIGVVFFSLSSDKYVKRKAAEADAAADEAGTVREGMKPEYRLVALPAGAVFLPAGLFIYGWTAEYHIHWFVPILGTAIVGIGNLIIFMALQMYLVDAFTVYAASALAANAVVRSVAGATLPLAGLKMNQNLGVGWASSILGFIAAAMLPVPLLIMKYGEHLRKRFELKDL